jgi:hypothetical protein
MEALLEYLDNPSKFAKITLLEKDVSELLNVEPFLKMVTPIKRKPDFRLSKNLYLDIDGLYWHSVKQDIEYHLEKRKDYEKYNLHLLQIREDELYRNPPAIVDLVNRLLSQIDTVDSNLCRIVHIDSQTSKEFKIKNSFALLDEQEIGGVGLVFNGELLLLASLKEQTITAITPKIGVYVKNGLKVLVNHCSCQYALINLRYETGDEYKKLGFFTLNEELDWCWTDNTITYPDYINPKPKSTWRKLYGAGIRTIKKAV